MPFSERIKKGLHLFGIHFPLTLKHQSQLPLPDYLIIVATLFTQQLKPEGLFLFFFFKYSTPAALLDFCILPRKMVIKRTR